MKNFSFWLRCLLFVCVSFKVLPLTIPYQGKNYIVCGLGTVCEDQYQCVDGKCCKNETCYSPISVFWKIVK